MAKMTGHAPGDGEDNVAVHVQVEREARGWSTGELARRVTEAGCPLSQSAVWRIENGTPRRKISVDELIAFSKVFGRSIEYLLKPARPEYPQDLIRAHLTEWVSRELATWRADNEAGYAFGDLEQIVGIYPGSLPHLQEMVFEMLEESHLTFLRTRMQQRLKMLPKRLAEMRRGHLFSSAALVAYWNKCGLSREEMAKRAREWGFDDVAEAVESGVALARGRRVPIEKINLNEDCSVKVDVAERFG